MICVYLVLYGKVCVNFGSQAEVCKLGLTPINGKAKSKFLKAYRGTVIKFPGALLPQIVRPKGTISAYLVGWRLFNHLSKKLQVPVFGAFYEFILQDYSGYSRHHQCNRHKPFLFAYKPFDLPGGIQVTIQKRKHPHYHQCTAAHA